MVTVRFPRKFVERCQRYAEEHPELALDADELIFRCGRLGIRFFSQFYGVNASLPASARARRRKPVAERLKEDGEKVSVTLPDEDYRAISEFVKKLQVTSTAIGFYMLCATLVMLGYWKLPERI